MSLRESFGKRLRQLRKENNLTQAQLAEVIGVSSDRQIRRWETGEDQPSYEHLESLAQAFGLRPKDLFPD